MNYFKPNDNSIELIEHIYSFIDSKLQFIDYQINAVVKSFEVIDSTSISLAKQREEEKTPHVFSRRFENMLKNIEGYSKMKAKLLIIRTNLNTTNAERSFDLLTDNKYMIYTEKILTTMLNELTGHQEVA